jgi:hypothetical protein
MLQNFAAGIFVICLIVVVVGVLFIFSFGAKHEDPTLDADEDAAQMYEQLEESTAGSAFMSIVEVAVYFGIASGIAWVASSIFHL